MNQLGKKKRNSDAGSVTNKSATVSLNKVYKPAVGRQDIDEVFPVSIEQNQLTPEMKQYIFEMEKEYLELQATLISNRAKYQ